MSYTQTHFTGSDEVCFDRFVPEATHLKDATATAPSPFIESSQIKEFWLAIKLLLIRWHEHIIKRKLYVTDTLGPLRMLHPNTRAALMWLTEHNYIKSWFYNANVPGYPPISLFVVNPNPIVTPSGRRYQIGGAAGNGCGLTLDQAALPALGEFVERYAMSSGWWCRTDMRLGSYTELSLSMRSVEPQQFTTYSPIQIENNTALARARVNADTPLTWLPLRSFISGESYLVPAAAVYNFFAQDCPGEPVFGEVSSNGAAAYTNWEGAVYKSVTELVERDAFLRSWYHQRIGKRISLRGAFEEFFQFKDSYELLNKRGVEVALVDITDDTRIPTVASVVRNIDPTMRTVVVSAATDLSFRGAVEKSLLEGLRFAHARKPSLTADDEAIVERGDWSALAINLAGRGKLWAHAPFAEYIEYFIGGPEVPYADLKVMYDREQPVLRTYQEKNERLRQQLKQCNLEVFIGEFTNPLASHLGLRVSKAVSPQLVPIFFDESKPPLGRSRFALGTGRLNPIPHPFL